MPCVVVSHGCRHFRGLPIGDAAVCQAAQDESGGVSRIAHVVVWAVGSDVVVAAGEVTHVAEYGDSARFAYASFEVKGLPHSGHSIGVSGSVSSLMVLSTSTNGTCANKIKPKPGCILHIAPTHSTCITTAACKSGRLLVTAATSRPPALAPWMMVLDLDPIPRE